MRNLRIAVVLVAALIVILQAVIYTRSVSNIGTFSFLEKDSSKIEVQANAALGKFSVISGATIIVAGGLVWVLRDSKKD